MSTEINSLRLYMRDINEFPLLTRKEENELAKKIQEDNCEKSLNTLIECNLRLVVKIASDYTRYTLSIEDFVSQGNIGLIKAAKRFNPAEHDNTCKFSSYAQWWINQKIKLYIAECSTIVRIPHQSKTKIIKISSYIKKFIQTNERSPSISEICKFTGYGLLTVNNLLPHLQHGEIYLDCTDKSDGDGDVYDYYLKDESLNARNFIDDLNHIDKMTEIKKYLNTLNPRNKEIISLRFGIFEYKNRHTLAQISDKIGITKERVRQVQDTVLYQLKIYLKNKRGWENSGVK